MMDVDHSDAPASSSAPTTTVSAPASSASSSSNEKANNLIKGSKEKELFTSILESMTNVKYEDQVPLALAEYIRRIALEIISDAKDYSIHVGKGDIGVNEILLAMKYNVSGLSNRRGLAEARSEVISKTLSKKSISNFIDNTTNKPEDINLDEYEYYYNYYQEIHHKDEKNDTNSIVLNSTDYLDIIRKIFYNISALDLSEKLITTEINIQDTEYVQLLQDISIEKKQESYDKIEKNLDIINQYSEDINNKLILFTSYYYYYLNYFTLLKKYGCSNNIVLKLNELVKNINKEFEESILTKYNIKLTEYNESSTSSSSSNTNSDTIKEYNNKYITNNYILYKILFYYCIKYFSLNDNLNQNLMLLNMISEDFLLLLRNSLQENNNINTSIINDEILFNEFNQYFYTKISTFDEILFTKTEEKNPDNVENKNENENTNEKDENISDLLKISLYNMLKKLNIIRKNLIIIKEEEKIKKLKYKKHTLLINFINNKKKSKISSYSLINSASGSDADSSHISPVIPSQSLINLKVNYPKNQLTQRFHTLISGEDAYHDYLQEQESNLY